MKENKPPGTGSCCPPRTAGVAYLKIGSKSNWIGMLKLDAVFKELFAAGRHPEQAGDQELVDQARKYNYITHKTNIEADYTAVLRNNSYFAGQKQYNHQDAE